MGIPAEIRTERLLLRPWRADDSPNLLPVLESNRGHLSPWIPARVAEAAPLPVLAERLSGFAADFDADREWRFGLFAPDTGAVLGEVSLFPRSARGRVPFADADRAEIGYWLRADMTGQGLVTEAARAVLDVASDVPQFSHAEIRCDARNAASAAIPRRLGFELATTLVDSAVSAVDQPIHLQVWTLELSHPRASSNEVAWIVDKITDVQELGYCVLREHFARSLIDACRDTLWPVLARYLETHGREPNRGIHRHFLPMPFDPPCFAPEFFFDDTVLGIVRSVMDDRVVADQWGCDVPVRRSEYQRVHIDYQRPLFHEAPNLSLPAYMLVVSFGLVRIGAENGPIEIAPGTHRMPRKEALAAVEAGEIVMKPVPLEVGDVLIRHPWALHRGTPNTTDTPRALASIRYVRRWYADSSRDVDALPRAVWESLTSEQQGMMRFPVRDV